MFFRRRALLPLRRWLLAAPPFSDDLLTEAKAQLTQHRLSLAADSTPDPNRHRGDPANPDWYTSNRNRPPGCLAPWVDTLDLDSAVRWLHEHFNDRVLLPEWPPVTQDVFDRMIEAWRERLDLWTTADVFDIGGLFGLRGMPYPPAPRPRDPNPLGPYIHPHAWLTQTPDSRSRRRSVADALARGHTDVLTLSLLTHPAAAAPLSPSAIEVTALGSVFLEGDERIAVLWREDPRDFHDEPPTAH